MYTYTQLEKLLAKGTKHFLSRRTHDFSPYPMDNSPRAWYRSHSHLIFFLLLRCLDFGYNNGDSLCTQEWDRRGENSLAAISASFSPPSLVQQLSISNLSARREASNRGGKLVCATKGRLQCVVLMCMSSCSPSNPITIMCICG